jgi:CD2 antigen cytoplasmic tail-binding protein 2
VRFLSPLVCSCSFHYTRSGSNVGDEASEKTTSDIDQVTHLASNLMSFGDTDIYSKTYEELVRSVRSSRRVGPSWTPVSADVKYEYKWDIPGQSSEVFGPFSEEEVKGWFKAAYFGAAGEMVKIRPVGGNWGSWADVMT